MKRLFLVIMLCMAVCACNTEQMKYGQGGRNACQYVREQVPELREDIERVEVVGEDSLLSDLCLSWAELDMAQKGSDFIKGKISEKAYREVIDTMAMMATDVEYSWVFGNVTNDSLRALRKYSDFWRKVYTVKVTMKSGVTKMPRVMMDSDGLTPYMMEKDMERAIQDHTARIMEAQELLW